LTHSIGLMSFFLLPFLPLVGLIWKENKHGRNLNQVLRALEYLPVFCGLFVVFAVSNGLLIVPAYLKIVWVKFAAILNKKLEESVPSRILKALFFLLLGFPLCVLHWLTDLLRCAVEAWSLHETTPKRLAAHCNKEETTNQQALLDSMVSVCKVLEASNQATVSISQFLLETQRIHAKGEAPEEEWARADEEQVLVDKMQLHLAQIAALS